MIDLFRLKSRVSEDNVADECSAPEAGDVSDDVMGSSWILFITMLNSIGSCLEGVG